MKINIVWLYPDILNLHGDRGNAMSIVKIVESMDMEANLIKVNTADELPDLSAVDLIIMGAGQLRDIRYVTDDIRNYEQRLKDYIENDGHILVTGSTGCIFGKRYYLDDGSANDGLRIIDMQARALNRTKMPMLTKEVYGDDIYWKTEDGMETIGCQIQRMDFTLGKAATPLGTLIYGYGNNCKGNAEGARYKNLMFTNTVGPLLASNPWFGVYIIKDILKAKGVSLDDYNDDKLNYMSIARNSFNAKKEFIKNKKKLEGIITEN